MEQQNSPPLSPEYSQNIPSPENPSFIPDPHSVPNNFDSMDGIVDRFLQILVLNGSKLPFSQMKALVDSLIDLFSCLNGQDLPMDYLLSLLKQSISSQESYDQQIENRFDGVYPDIVDIGSSGESFAIIPLRKSLNLKLNHYKEPDEISITGEKEDKISSYFGGDNCLENSIYLNFFIDDFQLANPLLSKKACGNEFKAFYYRIVTSNSLKFSNRDSIHLFSLCKTSVFKEHPDEVLSYLG